MPDLPSATAQTAELLERGLRRLAITFVNHAGSVLVKGVPLERLALVASQGVGFSPVADAFGATGLIDPQQSLARPDGDLRLKPDLTALRPLDPASGWAWAPGVRHGRDGEVYGLDQRGFCARQQAAFAAAGLSALAGFEIEWMVGLPQPVGSAVGWCPAVVGGPYGADRLVQGLDYLTAVAEALDAAELPWLQLHPEYGAGQFELSLAPTPPLEAADRLVAARLVIQQVSRRFGWICSFAPVVTADLVGNGGHLHLSVTDQGVPLLGGGTGTAGLTTRGEALLAGLLEQLPALMPVACALAVSYKRLAPGRWAAPFQIWGWRTGRRLCAWCRPAGANPANWSSRWPISAPTPICWWGLCWRWRRTPCSSPGPCRHRFREIPPPRLPRWRRGCPRPSRRRYGRSRPARC